MNRNIEVKARAREAQNRLARELATEGPAILHQHDVFFRVANGRLKLRMFGHGRGELIHYERPDEAASKTSQYVVVPTDHPSAMLEALSRALGVSGEVRKKRTLYLVGRTRVHLDEVENLGRFIELEVVLAEGEDESAGRVEAQQLMERLDIRREDLISGAYADLLAAKDHKPGRQR